MARDLFIAAGLLGVAASACGSDSTLSVTPGVYDVTAETVLPHLEESLRYATTRTQRCLGTQDATALFPLLRHAAFAGCALTAREARGEQEFYVLACANPQAATGTATFSNTPTMLVGVLELKMGGKNMTLSQRIHGPRVRACDPAQ